MFSLIRRFTKSYTKNLIIASICIVIESLLEISCPYLMSLLLDKGLISLENGSYDLNYDVVITLSIVMIVCSVMAFVFGFIFAINVAKFSKGLAYEIRKKAYLKIKELSFSNFDQISTSSLLTRLTTDVNIIGDTLSTCFRPLFRSPVMFIATLIIAISTSPELSIVFIIVPPILATIMFLIIRYVKPRYIKIQKSIDEINSISKESIISIKNIKSYVKEDFQEQKFNTLNENLKNLSFQTMSKNALMLPAYEATMFLTIVCLLFLGGYLSLNENYASIVVNISMFLTLVLQLMATVNMMASVSLQYNKSKASISRIEEFFNFKSEIINKKDSPYKIKDGIIEFKHVYFSYNNDENYVLKDINFKIDKNKFVGILGQTGSSKSTIIYLILRFYDCTKGEILIDGINIKDYPIDEIRKNFSISFQTPFLFSGTILENITWGLDSYSMEDVIKASKITCSYDFINNDLPNGFQSLVSEGGTNLSGGQRQRICLTRAIMLNPKLLILDDSFSALDKITEAKVKENIKKELINTTKIVISQKISAIKDSDEIIVLNSGTISSIGIHDDLKTHDPIYKDINSIQNEGL